MPRLGILWALLAASAALPGEAILFGGRLPPSANAPAPAPQNGVAGVERCAGAPHHIAYTADAGVFEALSRSMFSVGKHFSAGEAFLIHLIVPEQDMPKASRLAECFQTAMEQRRNCSSPFVKIQKARHMPLRVDYQDRPDLQGHAVAFARLFMPDYLPDVSRVLYLDADTLARGDLSPLFRLPLDSPLAAVEEGMSFEQSWAQWYPDITELVPNAKRRAIFNDGVMVLDLERWRAENVTDDLRRWASRSGVSVDDQLLLNLEFQVTKSFTRLPHEWNDLRVRPTGWPDFGWADDLRPEDELSHAQLLHWTGPKPWNIKGMREPWIQQYRELWELPGVATGGCA